MAVVLVFGCRLEEAEVNYRKVLTLKPDYPEVLSNLGLSVAWQGKHEEAMACYKRSLELKDIPEAHMNRGLLMLTLGDYERGWPEYDYRWRCDGKAPPVYPGTKWDGSPIEGRTILIYPEQGRGDFIQFVRYVPLLKARGANVILQCPESVIPLIKSLKGLDQIVPKDAELHSYDVHASVMDLPMLLGTRVETIPAEIPYLSADPALVEHWKKELEKIEGFRVGIMWQGSKQYRADQFRSIRLAEFAPLAKVEGVRLLSLQKAEGTGHLPPVGSELGLIDLRSAHDERTAAVMETPAIVMNPALILT